MKEGMPPRSVGCGALVSAVADIIRLILRLSFTMMQDIEHGDLSQFGIQTLREGRGGGGR